MNNWECIGDRLLLGIIGDGDVSHLSGAGSPLQLQDESHLPAELRAAHKIMQDNDVMPDWMAAGSALDQLESRLRQQFDNRAARYLRGKDEAQLAGRASRLSEIEEEWLRYTEDNSERVRTYNRDALLYNLKVPQGIAHKQILNGQDLIKAALQSQTGKSPKCD